MAAHNDAYLWWADKENPLVGRHGGLSAEEMIVPLLSVSCEKIINRDKADKDG